MAHSALLAIFCLVLVTLAESLSKSEGRDWILFKRMHNKTYDSPEIEMLRREIFLGNKATVEKFNAKESEKRGYWLGLNHLSDRTKEEMDKMNGVRLHKVDLPKLRNRPEAQTFLDKILNDNSIEVPSKLDWRKVRGRVSRVKNQGQCGSCWAFATTGVLEGQEVVRNASLLSNGKLTELSEQNLVDCDVHGDDRGCKGGFMTNALNYIKKQKGIDSEKSYPYEAVDSKCRFKRTKVVFSDSGSATLPEGDEQKLKVVVAKFGPVSVAIDATSEFQQYGGGVFKDDNCNTNPEKLNHAVLVVGYGTDKHGGDYWIVKNSWGEGWGEDGYIRMARNKKNMCGIATVPVIPTF